MKVIVRITKTFKIAVKPLMKKHPSLAADIAKLEDRLIQNPKLGTPLGNNTYKIRLQIKSKGKGKSGGARVISFLETEVLGNINYAEEEITVNLVTIYDKNEVVSISGTELKTLINSIVKGG